MGLLQTSILLAPGLLAARPAAGSTVIGAVYCATDTTPPNKLFRNNGATWDDFAPSTASGGSTVPTTVQGDIVYASGANTLAALNKNASATRYLSNTGASNNPAWAQVSLADGVSGDLPLANLAQGSALSVLGVTGNSTADNASIAAGSDHQVFRRSGTTVAFGAVDLAQSAAVTGVLPVANGGTGVTNAPLVHVDAFTLTNAQILALPTAASYVTLVAAPGANKLLLFHWCVLFIDANAGAYTNVDTGDEHGLAVTYGDWTVDCSNFYPWDGTLAATQLTPFTVPAVAGYPALAQALLGNTALKLIAWNDPGNFTGGNVANSGRGSIAYSIYDFSTGTFS